MRKTKIVCTLGPATNDEKILRDMILEGMNVARFNFSHGTHESHLEQLTMLKKVSQELDRPIATLLDTKGPEIRLGKFKNGEATLKEGSLFTLTPRTVEGTAKKASITFKELYQDVTVGSRIVLADGVIELVVKEIDDEDVICTVMNSGTISDQKGVNVPDTRLSMPYVSAVDRADIEFGIEHNFDFVASSFTRCSRDVSEIREILENGGAGHIKIIAKVENREGVNNVEEIIAVSDGIMIARGDMGVEIDFTEIPYIQKQLISKCYNSGRPAITATQMLESMMQNPRPTRAEISDVANAIYDGTSAIMLSGETAAGKFPVEAVRTMAAIAVRTESDIPYQAQFKERRQKEGRLSVTSAVAYATCSTAIDTDAAAILSVTRSGETARLLSKYRPETPVVACVMDESVCRQLTLSWGVEPILMSYAENTDEMIDLSVEAAEDAGMVNEGDMVIVTAGMPVGVSGTTNMMKAHLIGDSLITGIGIGNHNAIGEVCLINQMDDVTEKFKPGQVMVAPYTNNEMLDAMKSAAAIVTEEDGMSSHAAIVGLTLNKPVIVGGIGAMSRLKDGMQVTVDSSHGIVGALPD